MWARRVTEIAAGALFFAAMVALFLPRIIGGSHDSFQKYDRARSELLTYKAMLDRFHLDCGRYPTTQEGLRALRTAPSGLKDKWGPQPYTDRKTFTDPWGSRYFYTSNGPHQYSLKSYGADGNPGGEGYNADVEVEP